MLIASMMIEFAVSPTWGEHKPKKKNHGIHYNFTYKTPTYWLECIKMWAKVYNLSPYYCLAVASVESSRGRHLFGFGRISKSFYGPYGIHRCFLKRWDIDDPYINTMVGIKALARYGSSKQARIKALRKYNTNYDSSYYKLILHLEHKFTKLGVFDTMKVPEGYL